MSSAGTEFSGALEQGGMSSDDAHTSGGHPTLPERLRKTYTQIRQRSKNQIGVEPENTTHTSTSTQAHTNTHIHTLTKT